MITDEQFQQWRALSEKATPGPWRLEGRHENIDGERLYGIDAIESEAGVTVVVADSGVYPPYGATAEFIAAARTAVPALIDEVERLLADRDAMATRLDSFRVALVHLTRDVRGCQCRESSRKDWTCWHCQIREMLAADEADGATTARAVLSAALEWHQFKRDACDRCLRDLSAAIDAYLVARKAKS